MTIRQVLLDGAGTSGDGTTWNDLSDATSAFIGVNGLTAAVNASAAGDTVYVKGSGSSSTAQSWVAPSGAAAVSNPAQVLACKSATTANQGAIDQSDLIPGLRTGISTFAFDDGDIPVATISGTSSDWRFTTCAAYVYGVKFIGGDNITLNEAEEGQKFEECWFTVTGGSDEIQFGGSTGSGAYSQFINTKIDGPSGCNIYAIHPTEFVGGIIEKTGGAGGILGEGAFDRAGFLRCLGTDFSGSSDVNIVDVVHTVGLIILQNCRFPASHSLTTGASVGRWRVEAYGCGESVSGISTSEQAFEVASHEGSVDVETVITRAGGADDEAEGAYSHDMTTLAGNTTQGYNSLYGPWMGKQVTNLGSPGQTLEVFFTSDIGNTQSADWDDDEVWLEVLYPDDAGGSQFDYATTQMTLLGSASAVASDPDSSWTGGSPSLTKNNQKIQASIQAGYEGPVQCRVHFAPGANAETIYVCPDIGVV